MNYKVATKELWIKGWEQAANNRSLLRSVSALFGSNITGSLLGAIGGLIVARFLGPEETGLFRYYSIPLTYLAVLHLGTFDGLQRQIPYYIGQQRPDKSRAIASAAGAWILLVSVIVSTGFVVLAVNNLVHGNFYGVAGWLTQAVLCWGIFYGGYLSATYRTINQFVALARIQLFQAVFNFAAVFLVPAIRFFGLCTRSGVSTIIGSLLLHFNRPLKTPYRFNIRNLVGLLKIGLPFAVWGSLYTSIWIASESALMLSLGGVTALGLFSIAVVMREAMNVLPQAVYQVLTPRVVENFSREGSLRKVSAKLVWITTGLTGFMVVAVLVATPLLDILVPEIIPKYIDGIPLMKVCLWFAVVQSASLPLNTLFASGKHLLYGRGVLAGIIIFPVAAYFLAPVLGAIIAVPMGSLLGRAARTLIAYLEIFFLTRREN